MTHEFTIKIVDKYEYHSGVNLGLQVAGPRVAFPLLVGCSFRTNAGKLHDLPARWLSSPGLALWDFNIDHFCKDPKTSEFRLILGDVIFALWADERFTERLCDTGWQPWAIPWVLNGHTAITETQEEQMRFKYARRLHAWSSLDMLSQFGFSGRIIRPPNDQVTQRVRINELSRELGFKSKLILDALQAIGVTEPKTHSSSIENEEAQKVREYLARRTSRSHEALNASAEHSQREPSSEFAKSVVVPTARRRILPLPRRQGHVTFPPPRAFPLPSPAPIPSNSVPLGSGEPLTSQPSSVSLSVASVPVKTDRPTNTTSSERPEAKPASQTLLARDTAGAVTTALPLHSAVTPRTTSPELQQLAASKGRTAAKAPSGVPARPASSSRTSHPNMVVRVGMDAITTGAGHHESNSPADIFNGSTDIDKLTAVLSRCLREMATMLDKFEVRNQKTKHEGLALRIHRLSNDYPAVDDIALSMLHVNMARNRIVKEAKPLRGTELSSLNYSWSAIKEWFASL